MFCLLLAFIIASVMGQDCSQPCDCPSEPAPCLMGTSLVLDDCGCCMVCARQLGEPCSLRGPCDHHKMLYCDYTVLSERGAGICIAQDGQTCDLGGIVYRSGESFQPSCKHHCVCMDGEIGCVATCASHVPLPSLDCPYPRRIQIPGKCCEEWVCDQTPVENPYHSAMAGASEFHPFLPSSSSSSSSLSVSRQGSAPWPESPRDNCVVQTTEWSECTATCGMGVSSRVTNDNERCQLERQPRICMIRPCGAEQEKEIKKGKKCVRTPKAQQGMRFQLSGCQSTRLYKPKFCGLCTDDRCCTPIATITAEVEFHCPEGDVFRKQMMFIRSCSCHRKCPRDNDIFLASKTWRMTGDYDSSL